MVINLMIHHRSKHIIISFAVLVQPRQVYAPGHGRLRLPAGQFPACCQVLRCGWSVRRTATLRGKKVFDGVRDTDKDHSKMQQRCHQSKDRCFLSSVKTCRRDEYTGGLPSISPASHNDVSWSIWFFSCADTFPNLVGVPKAMAPASLKSSSVTRGTSFCICLPAFISSCDSMTD